jgi:hypothetical protein
MPHPRPLLLVCLAGLLALIALGDGAAAEPTFERDIEPFIKSYCAECHSGRKKKGGLDLTRFPSATKAARERTLWAGVAERVKAKEMPPPEAPQPPEDKRAVFAGWAEKVAHPPQDTECKTLATDQNTNFYRGYVMSRRLTRAEYANSVRDLVGLDLKLADLLPADGAGGEGFDNTGSALFTSSIHLEKYLDAADRIAAAVAPPVDLTRITFPGGGHNTDAVRSQLPTILGWIGEHLPAPLAPDDHPAGARTEQPAVPAWSAPAPARPPA